MKIIPSRHLYFFGTLIGHHLQLELLPQEVVLQAEGVDLVGHLGLGGLQGDGGDEEEDEERHPHSDVVNWAQLSLR